VAPQDARAAEPAAAIFDESAFLSRLMGDRPLAQVILQGFVADFPWMLDRLQKRFGEADGPGAALQAHALEGAAAAISAGSLRAIAQAMEDAAKAGRLSEFSELLPRTVHEFERLKDALRHARWA
jgi:HPt (histidine-containing phosphotransfer) domain-containing protein